MNHEDEYDRLLVAYWNVEQELAEAHDEIASYYKDFGRIREVLDRYGVSEAFLKDEPEYVLPRFFFHEIRSIVG